MYYIFIIMCLRRKAFEPLLCRVVVLKLWYPHQCWYYYLLVPWEICFFFRHVAENIIRSHSFLLPASLDKSLIPEYLYIVLVFFLASVLVPVTELEAVREGHQSEVLQSIAEEFPADHCFTLVFHGRQGNLDLIAGSPDEAQAWIQGVRKLIHRSSTMNEKERLDQYPLNLSLSL